MKDLDKKYYRISEVAEILGIPASTLRFWEGQFTVIKPKRTDGGTRLYTPADIEKIRMVRYLVKEKGMKLEAAQQKLKRNSDGISRHHEALTRLKNVRDKLAAALQALNTMKR